MAPEYPVLDPLNINVPKLSFVKFPVPVNTPLITILVAVFTPALNE